MPSLKQARQNNIQRIANGGETKTGVGPAEQSPVIAAPTPQQDLPIQTGGQRGTYPASFILGGDITDSNRMYRQSGMRSSTFPTTPSGIKTSPIIASAPASAAAIAATLALQTNGLPNPNQDLLNLVEGPGISLAANPDGSVIISGGGGDGLTHGTLPWESDPSYIIMRDDFYNNIGGIATGVISGITPIGQLGWTQYGFANAVSSGFYGGTPPNLGYYEWANNATTQLAGWMALSDGGQVSTATNYPLGRALMENPGWAMTWVFKTEAQNNNTSSSTQVAFSTAQKALYVGLCGITFKNQITGSSRPDVFIGCRYDTSPSVNFALTSVATGTGVYSGTITGGGSNFYIGRFFTVTGFANPANNGTFKCTASTTGALTLANPLSVSQSASAHAAYTGPADAFFTLEVVLNQTLNSEVGRNDVQGTTLVTSIAPVAGVWHRVDIVCNAAGEVTITLDGSATLTASVPPMSLVQPLTGAVKNKVANLFYGGSGGSAIPPWGAGSSVTFSGFTSTRAPLNKTFVLSGKPDQNTMVADFNNADIAGGSDTVTAVGYPALVPFVMMGNDDTVGTPTASSMVIGIDFFSLIWNPNLGPSAPGSPDPTLSRYF